MKKIIFNICMILLSVLLVGCGEKQYTNDYKGVYSYIADNSVGNSIAFYEDWGYYNSWVESKGYLGTGKDYIIVSFYSFTYTDETKETLDSSYSLYVKFDGSRHADYQYLSHFHSIGVSQYSNGIFIVGDYTGYSTDIKLTPSETNMKSQPKSSVSLLTTVLKNYMHSKDFTLDSLGYAQYK